MSTPVFHPEERAYQRNPKVDVILNEMNILPRRLDDPERALNSVLGCCTHCPLV